MYTLNVDALSKLVEEARSRYIEGRRPHVIVHSIDLVCFTLHLPKPVLNLQLRTWVIHGMLWNAKIGGPWIQSFFPTDSWRHSFKMLKIFCTRNTGICAREYPTGGAIFCMDPPELEKVRLISTRWHLNANTTVFLASTIYALVSKRQKVAQGAMLI